MTSDDLNRRFLHAPRYFVILSLLLHLGVLGLFGVVEVLDHFGLSPFPKRRDLVLERYEEFVQVDVVGLPDVLLKDKDDLDATLPVAENAAKPPPPEPEAEQAQEDKDAMAALEAEKRLEEEAKKKQEAEAREKRERERQEAMRRLQEEAERKAALAALAQEAGRKELKGNILSKGTSTKGNIGTSKEQYRSLIVQKIKQHFNVYSWQQKKDLIAVVHITIRPDGMVASKRIERSSQDRLYDSSVLGAVDAAQPLPVPKDLSLIEGGITIEFRPVE